MRSLSSVYHQNENCKSNGSACNELQTMDKLPWLEHESDATDLYTTAAILTRMSWDLHNVFKPASTSYFN